MLPVGAASQRITHAYTMDVGTRRVAARGPINFPTHPLHVSHGHGTPLRGVARATITGKTSPRSLPTVARKSVSFPHVRLTERDPSARQHLLDTQRSRETVLARGHGASRRRAGDTNQPRQPAPGARAHRPPTRARTRPRGRRNSPRAWGRQARGALLRPRPHGAAT